MPLGNATLIFSEARTVYTHTHTHTLSFSRREARLPGRSPITARRWQPRDEELCVRGSCRRASACFFYSMGLDVCKYVYVCVWFFWFMKAVAVSRRERVEEIEVYGGGLGNWFLPGENLREGD